MDDGVEMHVPDGFRLGVSTSAFQTEGAADSRGATIWDSFLQRTRMPEASWTVATDHLARMEEDIDLAAGMGLDAYRFSLSWARLMPDGRGRPRGAAAAVYDRMVDAVLERGMRPWPCLFHWDLPLALQERGGWRERDTAHYLADYAAAVGELLAGRADTIFVLNEPNVHAVLGHLAGMHAPGDSDKDAFLGAVHHQNLATGLAAQRLREAAPAASVGTILSLQPVVPAGPGEQHALVAALADAAYVGAFLGPIFGDGYPERVAAMIEPLVAETDLPLLRGCLDLVGVNYYTRFRVRADLLSPAGLSVEEVFTGGAATDMGWEVYPKGLGEMLRRLRDEYGNPRAVVTECGAAFRDEPSAGGRVEDQERARYLLSHLRETLAAATDGCAVEGFLAWTLVDNLEWTDGFSKRFGMVRLDPVTLAREPKLSYEVYRRVAELRAVPPLASLREVA